MGNEELVWLDQGFVPNWLRGWLQGVYGGEGLDDLDKGGADVALALVDAQRSDLMSRVVIVAWTSPGKAGYCGASNCSIHILRREGERKYERVGIGLGVGKQDVKLGDRYTKGMRDILLSNRRFQWDGRRYVDSASIVRDKPRVGENSGSGSGIVISSNGYVLTNEHVIRRCREVVVSDKTKAMVFRTDPVQDLAILKASVPGGSVAVFRDGRGIRPGDEVFVVGYPLLGLLASDPIVTSGIVSALAGPKDDTTLLQITAPIQPGNSGAPVLDKSGHVVGLAVGSLDSVKWLGVTGTLPQNVNFAINARTILTFLDVHDIQYKTMPSAKVLSNADITSSATGFTVPVKCLN
jgi:Trypsin-like peptidase domain